MSSAPEKKQKPTVVLNMFGASGVGKSTTAAAVYAELKMRGFHTELVREYVKGRAWAGLIPNGFDQVYFFGKQAQYESQLYGKLDVLVTDSPLLISGYYENYHLKREITLPSILNFMQYAKDHGVVYLNYWLEHYSVFDPRGRFETEESSKAVHQDMKKWLTNLGQDLIVVNVEDRLRAKAIVDHLESLDIIVKT